MIKTDFPRPIRHIEHVWIPMRDGARLAARVWLPVDAEQQPVPGLLEYIPYRKNDGTAKRDALRQPYLAGHGYACLRVDARGSGDSDGLLLDEYLPQELDDGLDVIAWLAAQPWCSGAVGMFGKSWGGFNALQVAALRPPALKAIITFYSTDDRYTDDIHYLGGCMFGHDHLAWAATMLAFNARPPDPRIVGERWREMWLERLEKTPPYLETWLRHQRRDAFWKHGSVNEDYGAIECAVLAVGGWADGYTNAVPRLLAGLKCPRRGLIGPWAHQYPETSVPGPAIGMLQESVRWWDHWLKGIDTGLMAEPMLRAYLQESAPPSPLHEMRAGRWVAEAEWPPSPATTQRLYLSDGSLTPISEATLSPGGRREHTIRGSQLCGLDAGVYYSMSLPGDEPPDQRAEDGLSLCFDSAPMESAQDVLGFPSFTLHLAADKPQALVAVRLCDVAPTGESTLVSRALLNLTHRDGHENPQPLAPGERYVVSAPLRFTGHSIRPGHRWRVAISPTYFPWAWPSPEPVTLTVLADSYFELPVRPPRQADETLRPFGPPETAAPLAFDELRPAARRRWVSRDAVTQRAELVDHLDGGAFRLRDNGLVYSDVAEHRWAIIEGDPLSAEARSAFTITIERGEWRTRIETDSSLRADRTHWHVYNRVTAFEGEARVFSRTHTATLPRDNV
jgi:putative CocE/NonD family hydrolase